MVPLQPNRDWGTHLIEAIVIFIGGIASAVVGAVTFPVKDATSVDIVFLLGFLIAAAFFLATSFQRLRSAAAIRKRNAAAQFLLRIDASSSLPGSDAPSSLPRFDDYDEEGKLQVVGGIRLVPVIGVKAEADEEECAICLGSLGEERTRKKAACEHVFHEHCVKQWLRVQQT
ncbi:hypothetical protein QOZ80_6AG0541960 [Eleusine coracana subsp. coracana]|nr:hypothetical protein QOZ80_6AG0541960 [Eleusine coracana subsp. coracana]